ncbi:sensor histidine kinase [Streptacidiphilus neutrinimicus]|uniref:sensor histidine kinase n=1 Tax=Streptacidiphilus neutrinimicus TaxID=105420 RepID=UPI0005A6DFF1|nr:HAMP domain-containing sensor histidine kinase [Streptacidiphilus neutrinimicus]
MIRSWSTWPLRVRLVVVVTLLLGTVFAAMATVTTVQLRSHLQGTLSDQLDDAIGRAHASLMRPDPAGRNFMQMSGIVNAVGVATDANGNVTSGSFGRSGSLTQKQIDALRSVPADGSAHVVELPGLGSYLVRSDAGALGMPGPGPHSPVVVGLSESYVTSPVDDLIATEAVLGVAGVILVGFVGFGLIRVSLRPLDRVAATAARISKLPLHEGEVGRLNRVPAQDTDPRTESGLVGASLNRMIDHVSAALEARHASETRVRQFVADASHELRTPLASIKGYAELTRRSRESVPPDAAYALGRVESEATRMTALVEDLLLLARLDAGRPLEREPVDLAPLVVDAVQDAHAAVPDHRWEVRLPEDAAAEVVGDENRLRQVLVNLLANAGKHTPAGTTVTASLTCEDRWAVLAVADDGPGIPQELLPTVFERFARGDGSRSRKAGSTGLGLAIVAAVVASHGGQVWVTSEPGETVFTVRLPLETSALPAVAVAVTG